MSELWRESAVDLARRVRTGETSALEVAEAHIRRAIETNDTIGALLHLDPEDVRRQARVIDRRVQAGQDPGALAGVPVAIKDNLCTRGMPTTCGSSMLEAFEAPQDAYVVQRLRAAGALLFAKTNMDEFGMGSSTEHSAFRHTHNPFALDRTPGGSSGGSAAAVACGMVPLALASDTGGSIRQPAAFCGVVGIKPTYGFVSRTGLVAYASSLDQVGPVARSVADAALLLSIIAGHDTHDATSSVRSFAPLEGEQPAALRGLRIGIPREYFDESDLAPEVRAAVGAAEAALSRAGAEIEEISLPLTRYAIPIYYILAPAEASSNLARYDGVRYGTREAGDSPGEQAARTRGAGFGREAKRRILVGTYCLSAGYHERFYGRAQRARVALRHEMDCAFKEFDALLTPTAPTVAFALGERTGDPVAMYRSDLLTVPANLCGIPALSVPCGASTDGLPIGLQLMAPRFGEETLLKIARAYEHHRDEGFRWPREPTAA